MTDGSRLDRRQVSDAFATCVGLAISIQCYERFHSCYFVWVCEWNIYIYIKNRANVVPCTQHSQQRRYTFLQKLVTSCLIREWLNTRKPCCILSNTAAVRFVNQSKRGHLNWKASMDVQNMLTNCLFLAALKVNMYDFLKDAVYSGGTGCDKSNVLPPGAHFLFCIDLSFLKRRLLIWFEKSELRQIIQRVLATYKLIGLQRGVPFLMPDKPGGNKRDTFC